MKNRNAILEIYFILPEKMNTIKIISIYIYYI